MQHAKNVSVRTVRTVEFEFEEEKYNHTVHHKKLLTVHYSLCVSVSCVIQYNHKYII